MKNLLAAAVLFFCVPAWAAPAPEVVSALGEVEARMRGIETMQTRFVQKKNLGMFNREIELSGMIAMAKPDRLAWRTESPLRFVIVAGDGKVSQWDEDTDKVQTLAYSDSPAARIVIEQMKTWFYGEYGALLDQYESEIVSKAPLTLRFIPGNKSPARGMVRSVTMQFRPDMNYIQLIQIEEMNGDRSVMEFSDTVLNGKIDPAVWRIK